MWELINLTMAINTKVLCYQKFPNTNPPFEATILESYYNRWLLKYQDLTGQTIIEKVNKGCCSTVPVPVSISVSTAPKSRPLTEAIKTTSVSLPTNSTRIRLHSPLVK